MDQQTKAKSVNMEDMQRFGRVLHNKGIGTDSVCATAAATQAKQVVAGTTFSLVAGAKLIVKFQNAITVAGATLTVGMPVDATAADYEEKNPSQEGWYELSSGTLVLTEDVAPASGKTYYTATVAKPIYLNGAALGADVVKAGTSLLLSYDGTSYNIIGGAGGSEPASYTGTCSTAADTAAKEVTISDYKLAVGGIVVVKFTNAITVANATLNVSGKGAKPIYKDGAALAADVILSGDTVTMSYDGTNYVVTNVMEAEETYEQIYVAVASPSGNPSTQGWYELSGGSYVATSDTSVVSGKTYYFQTDAYMEIE
jgi:hypothetical protein